MSEMGTRVLITNEGWPGMLAPACAVAVESLVKAGVKRSTIRSQERERVINEEHDGKRISGWSIDVIGEAPSV